jgi:23S rRNA (guanosine2251-2'-O)-methyltransferase
MAGSAKPRGAARTSSKKGPTGGTGGKNKRRLEGKGSCSTHSHWPQRKTQG